MAMLCFKRFYSALAVLMLLFFCADAQESPGDVCKLGRINGFDRHRAKTTVADTREDDYDIKHVHIDVSMTNTSTQISGSVTTTSEVLIPNFSAYVFELIGEFTIDSVLINGKQEAVVRAGDVARVFLTTPLQLGNTIVAKVYYHGTPSAGSVFFFQNGLNLSGNELNGSQILYTLSEPYMGKGWWPCKQSLTDKIDSVDTWVTVPKGIKAGSNGLLQRVTVIGSDKERYEWKTKYPIAYYLMSIAVGDYTDYSFNTTLKDGTVVPVQNYIYNVPSLLAELKGGIDSTGLMLQYYSELFGRYPFYKEKYGHCMAPVFGGMEHQTMTTLRHFGTKLVSHELAHQWFGDNVTCASWQDIWLNEGWASYSEYLFVERFFSRKDATAYIVNVQNIVLNDTNIGGSIYVPATDTLNPYRVFEGRLTYNKASAVLHMLRFVLNDDNLFFNICKEYQKRFAFGNANTEKFRKLAEELSGKDLSLFFKEWIYGEGYPIYKLKWNQTAGKVIVRVEQTTEVPQSVPFYHTPIEINLRSSTGDVVHRLDINAAEQEFVLDNNSDVSDIVFDPNDWLLNKQDIIRDYSIGLPAVPSGNIVVHPNPTADIWIVRGLSKGMHIVVVDLGGRVVWKEELVQANGTAVPTTHLSRGVYILKVLSGDKEVATKKLVKL